MNLKLNNDDDILLETLAGRNSSRYNKFKLMEEMQELCTVLSQKETKPQKIETEDPFAEEKEIADVILRLQIYLYSRSPEQLAAVQTALNNKLKKYHKWLRTGTYSSI